MKDDINDSISKAYKPYDIVTVTKCEGVGIIKEVNVTECQPVFKHQIQYHIEWLTGNEHKNAWFNHDEITVHSNMLLKIAQMSCGDWGSRRHIKKLLENFRE